ncbi:MAG: tRNA pseudouridine(55) synthase TruB [Lentisphaerae bacterium]|nr:tRNA pseudouridine(55) synthase TruB [Lentisphaerota bacterium]
MQGESLNGVLIIDKPSGPTSHDVVAMLRKRFRAAKVGHGGTLDPQATGLLVILLGKGTKLSDRFIGSDKTYHGVIRLGVTTDSEDAEGKVLSEQDCSRVSASMLRDQMSALVGDIYQTPPMVSAVKIAGVPLYKRARKGQIIERKARLVHIYEFRMLEFTPPTATFVVRCTKGTYVRTLCADIGKNLGCGAHLQALRRTGSGEISVENAIPLNDAMKMDFDALTKHVIPIKSFLQKSLLSS